MEMVRVRYYPTWKGTHKTEVGHTAKEGLESKFICIHWDKNVNMKKLNIAQHYKPIAKFKSW